MTPPANLLKIMSKIITIGKFSIHNTSVVSQMIVFLSSSNVKVCLVNDYLLKFLLELACLVSLGKNA